MLDIGTLEVKPYVASFKEKRIEFERILSHGFLEIRRSCRFLSVNDVVRMHIFTGLCRQSMEPLQLMRK